MNKTRDNTKNKTNMKIILNIMSPTCYCGLLRLISLAHLQDRSKTSGSNAAVSGLVR